jgi:hypothetical protein
LVGSITATSGKHRDKTSSLIAKADTVNRIAHRFLRFVLADRPPFLRAGAVKQPIPVVASGHHEVAVQLHDEAVAVLSLFAVISTITSLASITKVSFLVRVSKRCTAADTAQAGDRKKM